MRLAVVLRLAQGAVEHQAEGLEELALRARTVSAEVGEVDPRTLWPVCTWAKKANQWIGL